MLAFGRARVAPRLTLPYRYPEEGEKDFLASIRGTIELLSIPPLPGTNTVLVAHSYNLDVSEGLKIEKEGGAAVFVPDLEFDFRFVGFLPPDRLDGPSR